MVGYLSQVSVLVASSYVLPFDAQTIHFRFAKVA
jgi:hypothetical protein